VVLDTKQTIWVAAGAVVGWIALFLLVVQLAYLHDLYWLLRRDFEIVVIALAGLGVTLLVAFWNSSASHQDKVTIGAVSLASYLGLTFVGGLYIACANGNCL
jgi:hypothetical protein